MGPGLYRRAVKLTTLYGGVFMKDWAWQERAFNETIRLLSQGVLRVAVTAPTGLGKGRMIERLIKEFVSRGARVILFTDRRMLTRQTGERFAEAGIDFGYASASHGMDVFPHVVVASVQTIRSRHSKGKMELPPADLIICDEAHKRSFDYAIEAYRKANPGVSLVGYTASPVGLKDKYDKLVVAGTKPEGRAGGALVPCRVIGMPEPDMKGVKMTATGEYVQSGMVKRVMQCTVFADVFDEWFKSGHERPTLVWAPGVKESRWIVEQFREKGVTAEHIDGETSEEDRERIKSASKAGSVQVVSSYGVMREGIDWPWISYGILIQVCGAYETFVQIVGRILRAYPGKLDAILQDHSGTWHRHGSPNFDRAWSLDDTNISIANERKEKKPGEAQPAAGDGAEGNGEGDDAICCPKCRGIRRTGAECPHCGFIAKRGVRMIRKEGGELVDLHDEAAPKPKKEKSELEKNWTKCVFIGANSNMTFKQVAGMFYKNTGKWAGNFPQCQPKPCQGSADWEKRVAEVYPNFCKRKVAV